MAQIKIPKSASGIQKLAHEEFNRKERKSRVQGKLDYTTGDPSDKVWDNYQLTKGLKREFKELCSKNNIVSSKYLRACIKLLIKKKGNVEKALKAVENIDPSKLED